jgi:hypothetical protein
MRSRESAAPVLFRRPLLTPFKFLLDALDRHKNKGTVDGTGTLTSVKVERDIYSGEFKDLDSPFADDDDFSTFLFLEI